MPAALRLPHAWMGALLAVGGASLAHADDAVHDRVSEAPLDVDAAWQEAGFRLRMHAGAEVLRQVTSAPEGTALHFGLEPALQLDSAWSASVQLLYTMERPVGKYGLDGLRWSVTVGPAWHPVAGLSLGLLVGVAGHLSNWHSPNGGYVPVAGNCDAVGPLAFLRLTYVLRVTDYFATGPVLDGGLSRVACSPLGEGPTQQQVPPWNHYDLGLAWALVWR
ncbi:MAG TPA: hypothetical protein VFH51_09060 [Myxococcota bacterium]|nr:hypothetical protein [Myxococcota bacterium]